MSYQLVVSFEDVFGMSSNAAPKETAAHILFLWQIIISQWRLPPFDKTFSLHRLLYVLWSCDGVMQIYAWQKNKRTSVIFQLGFLLYTKQVSEGKKHLSIPRDNVVQMIDSSFLLISYVVLEHSQQTVS